MPATKVGDNMPQINDYVNYSTHGICKIEDQH